MIVNNRTMGATINVLSSGNRFADNGAGMVVFGGLSSMNTRADGNSINIGAHGDRFIGNTAASEFDRGGLIVVGGESISDVSGGGSHNTVIVRLWGCRMAGNYAADLAAVAARWVSPATAGMSANNQVTIEVRGDGSGEAWALMEIVEEHTLPPGETHGNHAQIIRH